MIFTAFFVSSQRNTLSSSEIIADNFKDALIIAEKIYGEKLSSISYNIKKNKVSKNEKK